MRPVQAKESHHLLIEQMKKKHIKRGLSQRLTFDLGWKKLLKVSGTSTWVFPGKTDRMDGESLGACQALLLMNYRGPGAGGEGHVPVINSRASLGFKDRS